MIDGETEGVSAVEGGSRLGVGISPVMEAWWLFWMERRFDEGELCEFESEKETMKGFRTEEVVWWCLWRVV